MHHHCTALLQGDLLWRGDARCRESGSGGGTLKRSKSLVRKKSSSAKLEPAHVFLFEQSVVVCRSKDRYLLKIQVHCLDKKTKIRGLIIPYPTNLCRY